MSEAIAHEEKKNAAKLAKKLSLNAPCYCLKSTWSGNRKP